MPSGTFDFFSGLVGTALLAIFAGVFYSDEVEGQDPLRGSIFWGSAALAINSIVLQFANAMTGRSLTEGGRGSPQFLTFLVLLMPVSLAMGIAVGNTTDAGSDIYIMLWVALGLFLVSEIAAMVERPCETSVTEHTCRLNRIHYGLFDNAMVTFTWAGQLIAYPWALYAFDQTGQNLDFYIALFGTQVSTIVVGAIFTSLLHHQYLVAWGSAIWLFTVVIIGLLIDDTTGLYVYISILGVVSISFVLDRVVAWLADKVGYSEGRGSGPRQKPQFPRVIEA